MKKKFIRRFMMGSIALATCCAMVPGAFAADGETEEQLPESILYYGKVVKVIADEGGTTTALRMTSERYGAYVMRISDETVWIDSGKMTASEAATLTEGEAVYIFHSAASTFSMPPQSAAYAVVRNIPQDAGCAQYMKVDAVGQEADALRVTAGNGTVRFTVDQATTFSAYRTKNPVTREDLQKGSRIMVWYADSREGAEPRAFHIMLLPGKGERALTRGAFLQLLYGCMECPDVTAEPSYTDVTKEMEVYDAVAWATETGIVSGYGDGLFGVNDPISREQMVTILWRLAHRPVPADASGLTRYHDAGAVSAFAAQAMEWAHQEGLFDQETDLLQPKSAVTVGEAEAALLLLGPSC